MFKNALILLHGRGATPEDILTLAPSFADDSFYIAAPEAPHNSWYPYSFMAEDHLNEPCLSNAIECIKRLIDETALPSNRIYIVGFSQGACLALEVAARFATQYGGIAAFSGGLIGHTLNPAKYQGDFKGTKVFMGVSDVDPHVPLERAEASKEVLEKMGADVTLKVYPGMGHTINEDEIQSARKVLRIIF